jgi:hypothetical protein
MCDRNQLIEISAGFVPRRSESAYRDVRELGLDDKLYELVGLGIDGGGRLVQQEDFTAPCQSSHKSNCPTLAGIFREMCELDIRSCRSPALKLFPSFKTVASSLNFSFRELEAFEFESSRMRLRASLSSASVRELVGSMLSLRYAHSQCCPQSVEERRAGQSRRRGMRLAV